MPGWTGGCSLALCPARNLGRFPWCDRQRFRSWIRTHATRSLAHPSAPRLREPPRPAERQTSSPAVPGTNECSPLKGGTAVPRDLLLGLRHAAARRARTSFGERRLVAKRAGHDPITLLRSYARWIQKGGCQGRRDDRNLSKGVLQTVWVKLGSKLDPILNLYQLSY